MKNWLLIVACLMSGLAMGQTMDGKISDVLLERLAEMPYEKQPVVVLMKERPDLDAMEADFRRNRPSQQERIGRLVPYLKEVATRSQRDLLQFLSISQSMDNVRSLWLGNIISLEADESLIKSIASRDDVSIVYWNAPSELEEYECVEPDEVTPVSPNGTEPGLLAINADEMWELGYTGYGTIAFGADTGLQPFHPAFSNRWMGLYTDMSNAWYQFNSNNVIPFQCGDHGTHTLGTILGTEHMTNDTVGVAMNANWIGGAIIVCNNFGSDDNIGAFQWAINPDGDLNTTDDMPTVINNSWQDPSAQATQCNGAYITALQAAEMAGISIIFSAGNGGPGVATITPPKNVNLSEVNVFCVGNLNGNLTSLPISNGSSRGPSICGGDSSLLIKPEVSAPGTSVRSCELDRTYGSKSGTSMAAPHVAGAILLLQEAFPELLSEDFKWALYLSARDLGEAGEDNNFGMGIIDVKAAYDYLIEQGHTPTPPRSTELDLVGMDTDPQLEYCGNTASVTFFVTNGGSTEITSFDYEVSVERYNGVVQWTDTGSWTGNLPKEGTAIVDVPIDGISNGAYIVKFNTSNPNGEEDPRPLNNALGKLIQITSPGSVLIDVNGLEHGTACEGAMTTLTGQITTTSDYFFKWYEDYQLNDFLASGKTYTFEMGNQEEDFYAEPILLDIGGEPIPTEGEYSTGKRLFFTVLSPIELTSVDVFAEEVGNRFVNITTLDDVNVTTKPIFAAEPGKTTVELNILLDPGTYKMNFIVAKPLLEKVGTVNFPYMVGTSIRIDSATDENSYPYFFNWKLERPFNCSAQRILVQPIEGMTELSLAFEFTEETVFVNEPLAVNNTTTGAVRYDWLVDGILYAEDMETPTFMFDMPGFHEVTMVATDADGCQSSLSQSINVGILSSIDFPSEDYSFHLFPNPTNGVVNVDIKLPGNQNADYYLIDNLGRRTGLNIKNTQGASQFSFNVDELPKGLYFFEVRIAGKPAWTHKLLVN